MNDTKIALLWLTPYEPVPVPVGSAVVRASDDLFYVATPDGDLFVIFVNSSIVMRVPERAVGALIKQNFRGSSVTVLYDRHP
jgi:hypothetical protein